MRVSVEREDPGYDSYWESRARGEKVLVRLGGIEISNVITADDTDRVIVRYKEDEKGFVINRDERGEPYCVTERLEGDVAIIFETPEDRAAGQAA